MPMTTLDTRPRAPVLRPFSLGSATARRPGLKMAMAPPPDRGPNRAAIPRDRARGTLTRTAADELSRLLRVTAGRMVNGRYQTRSACGARACRGLSRSPLVIEDGVHKLVCPLSLDDLVVHE